MLKRKTILLMVSAIALFGLVAIFEGNRSVTGNRPNETDTNAAQQQDEGEPLFAFDEEDVQRLEVQRENETLVFEKLEDDSWEMTEPEVALAESGAIAFLLSQVTNSSTHTLSVSTSDLRDFGLQNPAATVILTANDTPYTLTIGDDDFTGDQLYVRADPPANEPDDPEQIKVHVVSGGMRNAVTRPTSDWLAVDETDETDGTDEAEGTEGTGGTDETDETVESGEAAAPEPEETAEETATEVEEAEDN